MLKPLEAFDEKEGQKNSGIPIETRRAPGVAVRKLRSQGRATPSHEPDEDSDDSDHETTEIVEADISEFLGDSTSELEDDDHPGVFGPGGRARQIRRPSVSALSTGLTETKGCISTLHTPDLEFSRSKNSEANSPLRKPNRNERPVAGAVVQRKSALVDPTGDLTGDLAGNLTDALRRLDL